MLITLLTSRAIFKIVGKCVILPSSVIFLNPSGERVL